MPTSFHLFPNAHEVVLTPCDDVYGENAPYVELHLEVLALFRLPRAPAEAAAARAALAGVTRLEVSCGVLGPAQLAAALLHLPGLRAVSLLLSWNESSVGERGPDALGSDLVSALAGCPRLESLEWELAEGHEGALGSGRRPCRDERGCGAH
jgi:hypothetical protein